MEGNAQTAESSPQNCPKCGNVVPSLVPVESGLKLTLKSAGEENVPDHVCLSCLSEYKQVGSHGAKLRAEMRIKEQNRSKLWNARVSLVKQARQLMKAKAYSEAAVAYEKYIKTLEIVFDVKPGGLTPEQFKSKARQKELTVLTTAFWDLVCIYDTSSRYGNRQSKTVDKLIEFARFTPIYPNIIKKAESFYRKSKNPKVIKRFLKSAGAGGRCFIASAVFNDPLCDEVMQLCAFRDQVLMQSIWGRLATKTYYKISPPIAELVVLFPTSRRVLQPLLRTVAAQLYQRFDLNSDSDF